MITEPVPDPLQDTPQTTPIRAGSYAALMLGDT
jgi:hypothetical protein